MKRQNISTQGEPAYTLFYIPEGAVRLTTRTKHQPSAVTSIHWRIAESCISRCLLYDAKLKITSHAGVAEWHTQRT